MGQPGTDNQAQLFNDLVFSTLAVTKAPNGCSRSRERKRLILEQIEEGNNAPVLRAASATRPGRCQIKPRMSATPINRWQLAYPRKLPAPLIQFCEEYLSRRTGLTASR